MSLPSPLIKSSDDPVILISVENSLYLSLESQKNDLLLDDPVYVILKVLPISDDSPV